MGVLVHRLQSVASDLSVDLGGRQIGVTEEFLYCAQVGTAFQQVGGKRVAQRVWVHGPAVG